ncbi:hypothetical protein Tco_0786148 [Tanacetum coccineum]
MTRPYRAQISVRPHTPSSPSTEALIVEYASAPIPPSLPPSPLSPLSSPLPMIPSPPLLLPPLQTSPTYTSASLAYRVAMVQLRATSPLLVPSPPLLLPSVNYKSDIPETDMPFQKRLCLTTLASRFEIGESSTVAATGHTGHTLAPSEGAYEGRVMTAVGEVNKRVTDLATTQRQDAHELYVRDEDAQDDRALLRAQISLLTKERRYFFSMASSYEREAVYARQAWSRLEDRSTALKASIKTLEAQKMAPKKTTTPMTDASIKGLIAQGVADALAEYEATRNSRNRYESHDSRTGTRTERATHDAPTWWNSHVKTVGHDVAYRMTWKTLKKMMTDRVGTDVWENISQRI